jgi:hypothetical protein
MVPQPHRQSHLTPLLAVLGLVLGLLLCLSETASAAFNPAAQNPHYGNFSEFGGEWTNSNDLQCQIGTKENGLCGYESASDVVSYTMQNPWSGFDPEGLSAWSDFKGYWKGVGNGAGNMVTGVATMAWDSHPVVNAGQFAAGSKTGYQKNFEGGMAMAKAAQNLATSSKARMGALDAGLNHVNSSLNDPEKFGELAFNVVTAVATGAEGASLATSARATAGAAEAEVAVAGGAKSGAGKSLLPSEGAVGTYDDLIAAGTKGDNITPHHIPSANHMAQHSVSKGDGIAINMEQPFPGSGGRHRATFTYGTQADLNLTPRQALGQGVRDARRIYQQDGLYGPGIRSSLQDVIRKNRAANPGLFKK